MPGAGFTALPPHVKGDCLAPLSDVVGRRVHGFTRRAHNTRIPQSQAEKEAPLHVAAVPAMDTAALRHRMRPDVRARFDSVWKATFFPVRDVQGENASEGQQRRSHLMHSHASELVRLGIASPSDTPGTFRNVPFTVVEEKTGRLRQRFILWTQEANDLLSRQGYVAQVPLGHVSEYLDVVESERVICVVAFIK
ncbi:rab1 small GTP-binding protein [Diplonema papillatum]|nr:rab1 small GTP-binding protein [Diplonema papillatum]